MLERIIEWAKEHPYLLGSVVLAIIVAYFVLSSSGSSASTQNQDVNGSGLNEADYVALQNAQLQASTQLQEAQIAANAQSNQTNAQLTAVQTAAAAQVAADQLQQQAQLQDIYTSGQVALNTNSTQLQTVQAQVGGQTSVAAIGAAEGETISGQQNQTQQTQYADELAAQEAISQAQTQQAQANANVLTTLAQLVGSLNNPATTSSGVTSSNPSTPALPVNTVTPVTVTSPVSVLLGTGTNSVALTATGSTPVNTPAGNELYYGEPAYLANAAVPGTNLPLGSSYTGAYGQYTPAQTAQFQQEALAAYDASL
jgi:hypothetical protein